jgi:hypothetical protein
VDFPTRSQKNSTTAIDNIFIDTARNSYSTCPVINGLSDHDDQSITFNTITLKLPTKQVMEMRKINKHMINNFPTKISYKTWNSTFSSDGVNIMFNAFLDTYLKILYSSFPLKKIQTAIRRNDWITVGITTSCKHK